MTNFRKRVERAYRREMRRQRLAWLIRRLVGGVYRTILPSAFALAILVFFIHLHSHETQMRSFLDRVKPAPEPQLSIEIVPPNTLRLTVLARASNVRVKLDQRSLATFVHAPESSESRAQDYTVVVPLQQLGTRALEVAISDLHGTRHDYHLGQCMVTIDGLAWVRLTSRHNYRAF